MVAIVDISEPGRVKALHVCSSSPMKCPAASAAINNTNAIGIEIFRNANETFYSGRQISAVIRLVDFLLHSFPNVVPPGAADVNGNVITHRDQDPGGRKADLTGEFRRVAPSPVSTPSFLASIEDVVKAALAADYAGLISTKCGDALSSGMPGKGGQVVIGASVERAVLARVAVFTVLCHQRRSITGLSAALRSVI